MRNILIIVLCALPLLLPAQNKSFYDLDYKRYTKPVSVSATISPDYLLTGSDFVEISLSKQGYFTVGTSSGASDSKLDENCQITFGHPYAITSYPVFALDGSWYTISNYFTDPDTLHLYQEAGTLMFSGTEINGLRIDFYLVAKSQSATVEFIFKITNNDTLTHNISPGFVLDPALGRWGDGIFMNGAISCLRDTVLTSGQIANQLEIWEKGSGAKGIGSEMKFTTGNPEKIILANWHDIYNNFTPVFEQSNLRYLYDLVIKMYWSAVELPVDGQHELRWELSLIEPDFSAKVFTRWDLPNYISLDSGIIFPVEMKTSFEVSNTTQNSIPDAKLTLNLPGAIKSDIQEFSMDLESGSSSSKQIDLRTRIIYEERIVDLIAEISENNIILDSFIRKMYIPATPVSDTGLVVLNDSVSIANFPEMELIFSVEQAATGQRILDLSEDNIFLFENSARVQDFSLGKFSGGVSNLADVVFVLDVSGSMGDEKDQVVAYLQEFADSLVSRGYDYQIGLVTFSTDIDRTIDLTKDIEYIRQVLNSISLWGGVEDSPLALYRASELSFRPGSRRNIIWITDENYPEHSYTVEQIVNRMLLMDITVHGVGLLSLQTDWFNPIVLPTGGNFYDIGGNFRDILLDVTRFEVQDLYSLKYTTAKPSGESMTLTLEVHYAGLGVIKTYNISTETGKQSQNLLTCFPNPFNSEITLKVQKVIDLTGDISIFNILGQRINKFIVAKNAVHTIKWNGRNNQDDQVGSGFYIVQLTLRNSHGIIYRESTRILYLK